MWRGKYSSILDNKLKWLTYLDREILSWICIDETATVYLREILCLGECLTDRIRPSFILDSCIVSCISSDGLDRTKSQYTTIYRYHARLIRTLRELHEFILESYIFIRTILETVVKSRELLLWDISKMIVLDDVYPTMKELETNTKGRKSKIRRLDEDDDRSSR